MWLGLFCENSLSTMNIHDLPNYFARKSAGYYCKSSSSQRILKVLKTASRNTCPGMLPSPELSLHLPVSQCRQMREAFVSDLYCVLVGLLSFQLPSSFQADQSQIRPYFSIVVVQGIGFRERVLGLRELLQPVAGDPQAQPGEARRWSFTDLQVGFLGLFIL